MTDENEVQLDEPEKEPETEIVSDTDNTESVDETGGDETPEKEEHSIPKGVQKQLDKLKRQRYHAKQQAERERQEREYWQKKALEAEGHKSVSTAKPTVEAFNTYEEYLEALSDWKVDQRLASERQQAEASKRETVSKTRVESYQKRVEQAVEKYDDYLDVAHGDHWTPSQQMVEAIQESEVGTDIAYWLGSHPEEAERIASLGQVAQYREIGKLEERLSKPPPKKVTKAPPPIDPSGNKSSATKSPDSMEFHEFVEWRKKFINQRR